MKDFNSFINEIIENDDEIKKEIELLELKYTIINTLIDYRKSHKLSQTEFAEKIDVKQQVISRFEKGEVDPRLSFIAKLLLGMNKTITISDKDYINVNESIEIKEKKKLNIIPMRFSYAEYDLAV